MRYAVLDYILHQIFFFMLQVVNIIKYKYDTLGTLDVVIVIEYNQQAESLFEIF